MTVPEGAPRSPDGYYWWDGGQWQPVEDGQAQGDQPQESGEQASAVPQLTEDQVADMMTSAEQDAYEA